MIADEGRLQDGGLVFAKISLGKSECAGTTKTRASGEIRTPALLAE